MEYGCVGLSEEDAFALYGEDNVAVYHNSFKPLEHALSRDTTVGYAKLICLRNMDVSCCSFWQNNIVSVAWLGGWLACEPRRNVSTKVSVLGVVPTAKRHKLFFCFSGCLPIPARRQKSKVEPHYRVPTQ